MTLNLALLRALESSWGDAFYLLDTARFDANFKALLTALRAEYVPTQLSYSYKTNYTPALCKRVEALGGFAEVVSDMEYHVALAVGVPPERIIYNGPVKREETVRALLYAGGQVNIDGVADLELVLGIASGYRGERPLRVALRCNFDIGDGVISRFGFDVLDPSFALAIKRLRAAPGVMLCGLHCHFATRRLEPFRTRALGILELVKQHFDEPPAYISLGGGLFGHMDPSLAAQFEDAIPSYTEYAKALAEPFRLAYGHLPTDKQPTLFLEPGSALVGDVMSFVAKVVNIKTVRGKTLATVTGSQYNINPTLNKKNPPLTVFQNGEATTHHASLDMGGYTCIESDYLYRGYEGPLSVGDYVVFGNAGSYSVVLKPPFILPNVPVLAETDGEFIPVKRGETWQDLFQTFVF